MFTDEALNDLAEVLMPKIIERLPHDKEERYLSVKSAAQKSDYKEQTIRKWLSQKRIKNYGRLGSPRVKLSEILNIEE
jgi:hypothetical protein